MHHIYTHIYIYRVFWQRPVNGGLVEQLIIQHCPLNKLITDAILEAAVDLWATAVGVKDLEHLHLSFPVHIEVSHSAIEPYQNTTRLLQRAYIAANQLVGNALCEYLGKKSVVRQKKGD